MEFFHESPRFFSYPLQISFLRSSFSSWALRFVVVRLLPFLDAVDDALLVFPGQELHVNRQNGDAPFFSLAQSVCFTWSLASEEKAPVVV